VNDSCPNTGHALENAKTVIANFKRVAKATRHPLIIKLSAAQDCLMIAGELAGVAQAVSLNSVPWEMVFPNKKSPMCGVGGNQSGGGVSGKRAQKINWSVVEALVSQGAVPVIAPGIMSYEDVRYVTDVLKAGAWSGGTIFLPSHPAWLYPLTIFTNPCKLTGIAKRDIAHQKRQQF
jgi:dihydroorotate dehydrogenase